MRYPKINVWGSDRKAFACVVLGEVPEVLKRLKLAWADIPVFIAEGI